MPTGDLSVMGSYNHRKYHGLYWVRIDSEVTKGINTVTTLLPSEEFGVTTWTSLKP